LGNISIEVIHTPGHTLDGVCYYIEDEHVLISGDSLFRREVGRTDFVHGSYEQLLESIKTKLLVLPEDVVVYPGHGESTTIGEERQHNPYVGKMGNLFI
jgi:glyoxylase-like metal-dependent hydrolase (beta-lactamase superfamily II)